VLLGNTSVVTRASPSGVGASSHSPLPTVFFGYPSRPELRAETVEKAARDLELQGALIPVPWTSLKISGRFVIDEITRAISDAEVAVFDLTNLNLNVMFEVGYAIGSDTVIWLTRDTSVTESRRMWERVALLTTVGYTPSTNSQEIVDGIWRDRPWQWSGTIYDQAIREYLQPGPVGGILYLPSPHDTNPARAVTRQIERYRRQQKIRVITADPDETAVESLAWYAQQIYQTSAAIVHLTTPLRTDGAIFNARYSLLAGLAVGMGKPLLMLAEADFTSPIDYRDSVATYGSERQAVTALERWLGRNPIAPTAVGGSSGLPEARPDLSVELRSLRLGEPVAENEADELVNYFLETSAYQDLLTKNTLVFVGRKGTGKTANLLQASEELGTDTRNLVVVIKPSSYELDNLVDLIRDFSERGETGYLLESLWKYLIYTEIAIAAKNAFIVRVGLTGEKKVQDFLAYIDERSDIFADDFATRLEAAVNRVTRDDSAVGLTERRARISEALHAGLLQDLREHLGEVLGGYARIAVLVDNLDKTWQRSTDIEQMSLFLLGLLSSVGRITEEFAKQDRWRRSMSVTLGVFIRSDIYAHVRRIAREPDKIPLARLTWTDGGMLIRVIEERFQAARGNTDDQALELWERFFAPTVDGLPTREYLLKTVLPRPRDIIFLCSAAIASAVNRRATRVEAEDFKRGEALYSQNALEALQVENGLSIQELEGVMYEFAGSKPAVGHAQVQAAVVAAGLPAARTSEVVELLTSLSFLGQEVAPGRFEFTFEPDLSLVYDVMARHQGASENRRFLIHPAFRAYLEIQG
jgi:hypothetical protein